MLKGEGATPKEKASRSVRKGDAGEAKRMQRKRSIEAAREAEADESGKRFERAFAAIVPPKD